ncbi:unnamed protein product, partial [Heterotrigona itama]
VGIGCLLDTQGISRLGGYEARTRRRHSADRGCVPTIIAVFYYGTRASRFRPG